MILWIRLIILITNTTLQLKTKTHSYSFLLSKPKNLPFLFETSFPTSLSYKEKVFEEIQRPVFSLLESGPMSDFCTFLSYDMITDLSTEKHLGRLSDTVLDDIAEQAE